MAEVVYIHHDGAISGSAISLRNLLKGLSRRSYSPRVLLAQDGPARGLYDDLKIPVDIVPIRDFPTSPGYKWNTFANWKSWLCFLPNPRLDAYLRRVRPDLVHVNDKTMLAAGVAAKRAGVPVVWHSRSSYETTYSSVSRSISRSIIRRCANHIIAISEDETDGFSDLPNLSIIYNSVDFDEVFRASDERESIVREFALRGKNVIGTVSSAINEVRGTFDFIRAAGIAKHHRPDGHFKFIIVAPLPQGPSSEEYRRATALAREVQIENELVFAGFRRDALAIMSAMDVVLVCNRHGVLGRMPIEAMALGRPVVVTAGHSGKSRVVLNGETALVVPGGDPESMAASIIRLLDSPELCRKMGDRAREYAWQRFAVEENARAVMRVYEKVLAQSS